MAKVSGKKWIIVLSIFIFLCVVFLSVKFLIKPTDTNKQQTYTLRWSSVKEGETAILSLIKNQNYNEVEKAVDKLMSDFAGNQGLSEALYRIAEEYRWAGKSEEASAIYKKVVQNFPQSWHATRAEIGIPRENVTHLITLGYYASAQDAIDKMISDFAEHPDLPDALYWLADKYRWSGRHDEAKNLYQRIVQNYPNSGVASKAKLGIPREEIMSLILSQDYPGARKAIDKMIADFAGNPDLPDALYGIAETYRWSDKHDETRNLYQRIVQDYPDSGVASKVKLGISREEIMSLLVSGDYANAQKAIDKMIADFAKDPDLPDALYWIAHRYAWCGEDYFFNEEKYDELKNLYDEVKELYKIIIQNYPDNLYSNKAKLGIHKADVFFLIISSDYTGAQKAIDEMIADFAEDPDLPDALYWTAHLYFFAGRYDEAKNLYQRIVQDYPDSSYFESAKIRFARESINCLIMSGDYTGAQKAFAQMIVDFHSHPDLPENILYIASMYKFKASQIEEKENEVIDVSNSEEAQKCLRKAIEIYERLIKEFPSSPTISSAYWSVAEYYGEDLGDYQKAIDYFQKFVDNCPNDERAPDAYYHICQYYNRLMRLGAISKSSALPKIKSAYNTLIKKYPHSEFAEMAKKTIQKGLQLSPNNINFGNINKGTTITKKLYIAKPWDEELVLLKIQPSSDYLSANFSKTADKQNEDFEVEVTLAPNIPLGKFEEKLTIYTTSAKYLKIEIPVTANIKGDIEFHPYTFFFGVVKKGTTPTAKVTIFTTGENLLKIQRIDNPLEGLVSVAITHKTEGKEYEITATLKDNAPIGTIKGTITIRTNNSDQPKIEISVYALIKE